MNSVISVVLTLYIEEELSDVVLRSVLMCSKERIKRVLRIYHHWHGERYMSHPAAWAILDVSPLETLGFISFHIQSRSRSEQISRFISLNCHIQTCASHCSRSKYFPRIQDKGESVGHDA